MAEPIQAPAVAERPRILVVDDDPGIVAMLARYLGGHGFLVESAASGAQMRSALAGGPADLVLLDLGLPDADGLSLLRDLQAGARKPVIVISGRDEAVERVVGLELGADDYVTKPFDLRELLARIRSVLRRSGPGSNGGGDATRLACLAFDGLQVEPGTRRVRDRDGLEVALTSGEFELLEALLERPREVLTRDVLMTRLHRRVAGPFDRAIDVGVGRLRRKLERDPAQPRLIKSVRGAGYMLACDVTHA